MIVLTITMGMLPVKRLHFEQLSKEEVVDWLEAASEADLWSYGLWNMAELFFPVEMEQFTRKDWWVNAQTVLQIGSRTGEYLRRLEETFPDKSYRGIEKKAEWAKLMSNTYQGDPEEFQKDLVGQFDVVLIHMILQYLDDPYKALMHASQYLKREGRLVIIGACDSAQACSRSTPLLREALQALNREGSANRTVTLDILRAFLPQGELEDYFALEFSNLDEEGLAKVDCHQIRLQTPSQRAHYFTCLMLFLASMQKEQGIAVDLSRTYDELHFYIDDETAWVQPSTHLLICKKSE